MKEFYIAPEVEIVCFAPIERLAAEWQGWGGISMFSNEGTDDSSQHITVPNETGDPDIDGDKG